MNILSTEQFAKQILDVTGIRVPLEKRTYELKPLDWWLKEPWYGLPQLTYIDDAANCYDFNTVLEMYWLKRHWDKAEPSSPNGAGSYPSLPMCRCKVRLYDTQKPHWLMLVGTPNGLYFVNRTQTSILPIGRGQIEDFLRIDG